MLMFPVSVFTFSGGQVAGYWVRLLRMSIIVDLYGNDR
jgi:hypothetical protein